MVTPDDIVSVIVNTQVERRVRQEMQKFDMEHSLIVIGGDLPQGLSKEQIIHDVLLAKVMTEIILRAGLN